MRAGKKKVRRTATKLRAPASDRFPDGWVRANCGASGRWVRWRRGLVRGRKLITFPTVARSTRHLTWTRRRTGYTQEVLTLPKIGDGHKIMRFAEISRRAMIESVLNDGGAPQCLSPWDARRCPHGPPGDRAPTRKRRAPTKHEGPKRMRFAIDGEYATRAPHRRERFTVPDFQ